MPSATRAKKKFLTFNFSTMNGRVLVGMKILTFFKSEFKYYCSCECKFKRKVKKQVRNWTSKPVDNIESSHSFPIFFAATAIAIPALPPLLPMKWLLPSLVWKVIFKTFHGTQMSPLYTFTPPA